MVKLYLMSEATGRSETCRVSMGQKGRHRDLTVLMQKVRERPQPLSDCSEKDRSISKIREFILFHGNNHLGRDDLFTVFYEKVVFASF